MLKGEVKAAIAVAIAAYLREETRLTPAPSRASPWKLLGRLEALKSRLAQHPVTGERGWRYDIPR